MKGQKLQVLELVKTGHDNLNDILTKMKEKHPDIKRSTVRGRLCELIKKNELERKGNGYREFRES